MFTTSRCRGCGGDLRFAQAHVMVNSRYVCASCVDDSGRAFVETTQKRMDEWQEDRAQKAIEDWRKWVNSHLDGTEIQRPMPSERYFLPETRARFADEIEELEARLKGHDRGTGVATRRGALS